MTKVDENKLREELKQFTGTEQYYYLPIFKRFNKYTEGIKYLAEEAEAYWLLEYIFSSQVDERLRGQEFQIWKLEVQDDDSAIITVEDGNDNVLKSFKIPFTDFPIQSIDLWLVDSVLILPSEY